MSSEKNWKTPAAVIGILTVLISVGGLWYQHEKNEEDRKTNIRQQENEMRQQENQENRRQEKEQRVIELRAELSEIEKQLQESENKINTTYRQIQEYDFKQNDPEASQASKDADHQSYLIAQQNLQIFNTEKKQLETRRENINQQISNLSN